MNDLEQFFDFSFLAVFFKSFLIFLFGWILAIFVSKCISQAYEKNKVE